MRVSKWKKKIKGNAVIGLMMVIALIISSVSGITPLSQAFADVVTQEAEESEASNAVEGVIDPETTDGEGTEVESTAGNGEGTEVESTAEVSISAEEDSTATTGEDAEVKSTAEVGKDQKTGVEASQEDEISTLGVPVETTGYNLYSGFEVDTNNYIGTYSTWAALVAAVKNRGAGEYSIDLYNSDLTPATNWSTAFNTNATSGNTQFSLHFYTTTQNKLTLNSGATMGAHVRFHAGLELATPTAANLGGYPLSSQIASASDLRSGYNNNYISANGWQFIVDKGVEVTGAANLYAGIHGTSNFVNNKTVIDGVSTGYLEINSGRWRYIGASTNIIYGSYQIIIGSDDDPANPVHVDAVFGRRTGTMYPNITDPDTPSEYIEITGNTVVEFGAACLIYGSGGYSTSYSRYTTQKVVVGGNATILSTWGAVTEDRLTAGTALHTSIRTSVTAGAVGNGYGHYTGNSNIVNLIVDISDSAYIAGDVVGTGANMYFNVHSDSKGIHISIKDHAQVGGNVVYGGSSSASTVKPDDTPDDPFFTMEVIGAENSGDVKIGGHLLATNGQDNSSSSSWNIATKVINAEVNGSVFGYGNLASESISTGISIKRAAIIVENSRIGGGVYGIAAGSSGGACKEIYITINKSTVGHVAPIFKFSDGTSSSNGAGNITNYPLGISSVEINNSTITGRTVMWRTGNEGGGANNLPSYSFVTADGSGTKTPNLKALATITMNKTNRAISFNTDGYTGIELSISTPEISLTTSMDARAAGGMTLAGDSIGLAQSNTNYPGKHTFTVTNTDFARTNGDALVSIIDSGDGTLGTSAEVTVDNCYATASDAKINVAIFARLTGTVTTSKVASMQMNLKNTNDLGEVGFARLVSGLGVFIDTKATIVMDNTVADYLFGKRTGSNEKIRSITGDDNRIQFLFKNHNTITNVYANGADIIFTENSVSYLNGIINNTGTTVHDKEYIETKSGARVYLGNTGSPATRHALGGAKTERIFGSISGRAGELYIYKDTDNANATYPIYVAPNGSILEVGMNLGEWTADTRELETAYKNTELTADTGNVEFKITEPTTSKTNMLIQDEHDILIAFGKTDNAVVGRLNDIPLRPWPLVKYSDVNNTTGGEEAGWIILGKPRYQVIYRGSGVLDEDLSTSVSGTIGTDSYVVKNGNTGTVDDYLYMLQQDNVTGAAYKIEDLIPTADADAYYTFQYWMLCSTEEIAEGAVLSSGQLVPEKWDVVDEIPNSNASDQNRWVVDDEFTLKSLLESGTLKKENSKVLTLVPVYQANYACKIGNQGYFELSDAFAAINDGSAAAENDGSYVIKMLVETYEIKESYTIADGQDITITTAGETDTTHPYKGAAGTKSTLLRYAGEDSETGYSGCFFDNFGILNLSNIILDGNKDQSVVSGSAFIQAGGDDGTGTTKTGDSNLLSGSVLQNNMCNGDETTASAIQSRDEESLICLKDTIIKDNVTIRPDDSVPTGAIVSGNVVLEGKVIVTDNYHVDSDDTDNEARGDICLKESILQADDTYNDTAIWVEGTLAEGSDVGVRADIGNHVDMYEFAQTGSEEAASESMKYFRDDYDQSLEIVVSTLDARNIMFEGTAPFSFTKVKAENTSEILEGVEFERYRLICEDTDHAHTTDTTSLVTADNTGAGKCWEKIDMQGSDENGLVDFGGLQGGVYMLVETKAHTGYQLPAGQWQITVALNGSADPITITAHGAVGELPPAFMKDTTTGTTIYKLPNIKTLALPLSGMSGIRMLQILGALLAASATLLYILRKRRNDRYRQTKI